MKSSKLIFLTFVSLLVIGGQNQVRYFLSELDFLANRDVPKSEVIRKQHIRAEYDPMNRLVRKTFVDRSGRSLRSESYSYIDTNTVARQKELIDSEGKLFLRQFLVVNQNPYPILNGSLVLIRLKNGTIDLLLQA